MPLQTRKVFVDTQSFVKAGLDFTSNTLQAFRDICGKGDLNHITTTVTVEEVNRKITESIQEALKGVIAFRRKAKLLAESDDVVIKGLFTPFDSVQVEAQALQVFSDFLEDADTTILDLSGVDPGHVFDLYFKTVPPFQNGKKSEFPDAFTLLALDAHLANTDQIYVISEDTDLKSYCETNQKFILAESLLKVVDLYNTHENARAEFLKELIASKTEEIKATIKQQVEGADAYNDSTWDDSEVDSVKVIAVADFEPSIVSIDDEECLVSFDVDVRYIATVTGPDFINGIYDREDDRMIILYDTTREEEADISLNVEIKLAYEVIDGDFKHQDFSVNVLELQGGLAVCVDESPYEDYR